MFEYIWKAILGIALSLLAFLVYVVNHTRKQTPSPNNKRKTVCFFHPDLGIGGAERLVIDAAVGLNEFHDCNSIIVTTSYEPKRCFQEVKPRDIVQIQNDDSDADDNPEQYYPQVIVCGGALPRAVCGRFVRLCKTIAMTWAVLWMALFGPKVDACIVDQLSFTVLLLRVLYGPSTRIVFYCHFPDFLCDPNKAFSSTEESLSSLTLYTKIFNYIEKVSMCYADSILYNSGFTQRVTEECFGRDFHANSSVAWPAVSTGSNRPTLEINEQTCSKLDFLGRFTSLPLSLMKKSSKTFCIVCISRFEPKKNHILALEMLEEMFKTQKQLVQMGLNDRVNLKKNVHFVFAGGYDSRLADNVTCMRGILEKLNEDTRKCVSILPNISDDLKWGLLHRADAVVFTPVNEHFGIVPLEAMACGKPVVACESGGAWETMGSFNKNCAVLLEPEPVKFATAMLLLMDDAQMRKKIGHEARIRVESRFSIESLASQLHSHLFMR